MVKYTKGYLSRLEDLVTESGYFVRYERGNFKSGYCVLKESQLILINNFLPLEGRVNCMLELVAALPVNASLLSEKSLKLYRQLMHKEAEPEISFSQTP